jgi:hypothetical protein
VITILDTLNWSQELVTGNAEFVEVTAGSPPEPVLYVVSNVRTVSAGGFGFGNSFGNNFGNGTQVTSFVVLQSTPIPPSPGPGASFLQVAEYEFSQPNLDFDPVVAYDQAHGLLHIVGTRNTPTGPSSSSPQLSDLIKFTFNTNTNTLYGPEVLTTGSRIRGSYDIVLLPDSNTVVAVCLADPGSPLLLASQVTGVEVVNDTVTLQVVNPGQTYSPGQWLLIDGLTNATFLNGQLIQVVTASQSGLGFGFSFGNNFGNGVTTTVTAAYVGANYPPTPETSPLASATPVGESLLVMERATNLVTFTDTLVPGSAYILDSSPSRTGNSYDACSLVCTPADGSVELYYQTHPKNVTFQDQVFNINLFNRRSEALITATSVTSNVVTVTANNNFPIGATVTLSGLTMATFLNGQTVTIATSSPTQFTFPFVHGSQLTTADTGTAVPPAPVWDAAPTNLTSFSARWADNRLTVILDTAGNRYMSQTYWTQLNHPEGIVGNAFLGIKQPGQPWSFHPTFGSTLGGSIIQGTLSIDANLDVSYVYLLQPFDNIPAPPSARSWPLHVASVAVPSLGLTEVPGFYNTLNMTWLRGTKSMVDDLSGWAVVGENETSLLPPTTSPVYVSLFNVPPIAELEPTNVTLWRNNTFYATDIGVVTSFSVLGNVVTVNVNNDFAVGQQIAIYGFQNPPNEFLNGVTLTVLTVSPTQFTAAYVGPNYSFQAAGPGFGEMFGVGFGVGTDMGFAAVLIPGPLFLDASGSYSPSLDPLGFVWTDNYPNANVTLTPSASGTTAELTVSDAVGGPGFTFDAGVAVVDLFSNHPPANATAIQVSGNVVTFTINNLPDNLPLLPLAPGEQVMPYDITSTLGFGINFGYNFGSASVTPFEFLNDQVLTVLETPAPTATSFSAVIVPPVGFPTETIPVAGFVMPQFQFQQAIITVPTNVAPTITFPSSSWSGFGTNFGYVFGSSNLLIARNTVITITPDLPLGPNQYPVVYTGVTDPDDSVTYLWQQVSGTPVALTNQTTDAVTINTAGANILGETLEFELTVNDGVNLPVSAFFAIVVPAYAYSQGRDGLQLSRSVFGLGGFGYNFGNSFGGSAAPISLRNTPQTWSPLDISIIFSDLQSVKRTSVLDGTDRYIVISPLSVLVYAVLPGVNPTPVLLRVLLTPGGTLIQDAVHTEQDYTLVLDAEGNVFRYTTAPNLYTDAPDTTFSLDSISSLSFVDAELDNDTHILTTQSFLGQRVLVFSGEQGALLLQVDTDTLAVTGFLELTTADHFLYGADKVQFVRWVGMENLRSGDVLLGTIANNTAVITEIDYGVAGGSNALTVTCANTFAPGDVIVLSGITFAPSPWPAVFNGMTVTVVSASPTAFVAYLDTEHMPQPPSTTYGPAPETGFAVSQHSGSTYESLINLSNKQIIGTWSKSQLKNQFVNTGEILFQPDTTYSGRPIPPVLAPLRLTVSGTNANISLSWTQSRADLVSGYTVQAATETILNTTVALTAPLTFQVPSSQYFFDTDMGVTDVSVTVPITQVSEQVGLGGFGLNFGAMFATATIATIYAANNLTAGQQVTLNGLTTATWLNGLTLTVETVTPTQFTVVDPTSHAAFPPTAETGTAFAPLGTQLVFVPYAPGPGQYTVSSTGLYQFNATQAGHSVDVAFLQVFVTVATVTNGSIESVVVQLPAGPTYFLRVGANSLDGFSGYSNVQQITT